MSEKIMGFNKTELFSEIMIQMHTLWCNKVLSKKRKLENSGISDLIEFLTNIGEWLKNEELNNSWLQKNLNRYTTGEYSAYKNTDVGYVELPDEFYEDLMSHLFPNLI